MVKEHHLVLPTIIQLTQKTLRNLDSLHICKIYFEISSNLAKGKGEELDFSSDYTYSANV